MELISRRRVGLRRRGMNAVLFASHTGQSYGVDISADSLEECAKQVANMNAGVFMPIHIDAANPAAARLQISGPIDLFLCTYVFELIPSPEYGLKLMEIAYDFFALVVSHLYRSVTIEVVSIRSRSGAIMQGTWFT